MANLLILHGPNLNLLGNREPDVYGHITLDDINKELGQRAEQMGHELNNLQSNAEHELVDAIQLAGSKGIDFIIINPGAFTHTSVALRDALLAVNIPFIEVHLSNIHNREEFRQVSYLADLALGGVFGFGAYSYALALEAAHHYLQKVK